MGVRRTMGQPSDEARYVAAAKRGSEDAWRHLVEAHQERLIRLAWSLTGQRELAAELAQDTFVEARRRRHQRQSSELSFKVLHDSSSNRARSLFMPRRYQLTTVPTAASLTCAIWRKVNSP